MRLIALFCVAASLRAQFALDPKVAESKKRIEGVEGYLATKAPPPRLSCHVTPIKPLLNFAFRYQTGYRVGFPMRQFSGERRNHLVVYTRVKPQDGSQSFYFYEGFQFPRTAPQGKADGVLTGGFHVGEGKYRIDFIMLDAQGRSCHSDWNISVQLSAKEREIEQPIGPGMAAAMEFRDWGRIQRPERQDEPGPFRIAILMHAAPLFPRSIRLGRFDQSILMTTVSTLLEQSSFEIASIDAFNLHQQKEILTGGRTDSRSFRQLLRGMQQLNLSVVDVSVLQRREGESQLLASILNREQTANQPPDALIFIGPTSISNVKLSRSLVEEIPGPRPLIVYLHHNTFGIRYPFPDLISQLTKSLGGREFSITNPRDMLSAIGKVKELLVQNRATARRERAEK